MLKPLTPAAPAVAENEGSSNGEDECATQRGPEVVLGQVESAVEDADGAASVRSDEDGAASARSDEDGGASAHSDAEMEQK